MKIVIKNKRLRPEVEKVELELFRRGELAIEDSEEDRDDPKVGQVLAFKCLQIGPDYNPQLTQYIGELKHFDENSKMIKMLVTYDENEGKHRLDKFEIDEVINGTTLKNREVEFSWPSLSDVRLIQPLE